MNVRAENNKLNPSISIDVRFEEPTPRAKSYMIYTEKSCEEKVVAKQETDRSLALVTNLIPGEEYIFNVSSKNDDQESIKAYSQKIQTCKNLILHN